MSLSENTVNLELESFDMQKIKDHAVIFFVGKRNTGKSVLVLDFLYHKNNFPIVVVISPTDVYNKTFSPHVPQMFIHNKFDSNIIKNIIARQKKISELSETNITYKNMDKRICIVFDDLLADAKNWINDENIKWIFNNGRHAYITFVVTLQYIMIIPRMLRSNTDYIFLCKETKQTNQKRIYDEFGGMFPSFEMFKQTFNKSTDNYGCIVIDNTAISHKIEEQVFYYKADLSLENLKTFKLCSESLWKINDDGINKLKLKKEKTESPNSAFDEYCNIVSKKKILYNIKYI